MKTSIRIAVFAVVFAWACIARAQAVQYVMLCNTNVSGDVQYSLQTNQIVSLVGGYQIQFNPPVTKAFGTLPDGRTVNFPAPSSGPFQIFTGLTNLILSAGAVTIYAVFQITTPATGNVISNYVPADAVVIPSSVTGNVQIILESSTDLLNWTAANPGTYSAASATNRFFRVRAALN
jgi:hypothetical protein